MLLRTPPCLQHCEGEEEWIFGLPQNGVIASNRCHGVEMQDFLIFDRQTVPPPRPKRTSPPKSHLVPVGQQQPRTTAPTQKPVRAFPLS